MVWGTTRNYYKEEEEKERETHLSAPSLRCGQGLIDRRSDRRDFCIGLNELSVFDMKRPGSGEKQSLDVA